jgi:conjugal transfer/type IV secretion protein DotA/TraY
MINVFQLAPNDQSVYYLGQIFGNVGVALAGTGPALLGQLFKVFNTIMLSVAVIIITYVSIVGVMKTAAEGEVLGKGWSTLWVPLRTVLGVAALMPTTTGYCAAQVIIMWFVVQGVGAADMVWNAAIDYFAKGGGVITPNPPPPTDVTGDAGTSRFSQVMQNLVCEASVTKFKLNQEDALGQPQLFYFNNDTSKPIGYYFGRPPVGDEKADTTFECGSVNWNIPLDTTKPDTDPANTDAKAMMEGLNSAYQGAVPTMNILANYYVTQAIDDPSCWVSKNDMGIDCTATVPNSCTYFEKWMRPNFDFPLCFLVGPNKDQQGLTAWNSVLTYTGSNFLLDVTKLFSGYANNYAVNYAVANKEVDQGTGVTTGLSTSYQKAQMNGWIFAGAFYYYIAKTTNVVSDSYNNFLQKSTVDPAKVNDKSFSDFAKDSPGDLGYVNVPMYEDSAKMVSQAATAVANTVAVTGGIHVNATTGGGSGPAKALRSASNAAVTHWINLIAPDKGNPIVNIATFGHSLLMAADYICVIFFGIALFLGVMQTIAVIWGTTVNWGQGLASSLLSVLTPAVFFLVAYFITVGGFLGVYVPLIPFVIFTMGAIGWFIVVIEAIVAGPIIAIGLLSPGGQHEIFSKAEPAIMLTLNLMLRPTLMVIGLFAGMLLSIVVVSFIHSAIYNVIASVTKWPGIFETFIYIVFYVGLIVVAMNKCFELIYHIPDRVMHWIGHQAAGHGEAQALEALKGKVSAGGEAAVGGAKGVGGAASQAAGAYGKSKEEGQSSESDRAEADMQKKDKSKKDKDTRAGGDANMKIKPPSE